MNNTFLKSSFSRIAFGFAAILMVISLNGCANNNTVSPSDIQATTSPASSDITVKMAEGELLLKSNTTWKTISADAELKTGDVIRTGKGAESVVDVSNVGQIYLAGDTEIEIAEVNHFSQHYGRVFYQVLSESPHSFSVDALEHHLKTKGAMEVSVNLDAKRVNAKALKSSIDSVARFPDVNELPQTIKEGEEITLDPASENLVSEAVVPGSYYATPWFANIEASSPDYFTQKAAEKTVEPETAEEPASQPKTITSPPAKTPPVKTTSTGLCRPYLTAKKDSTYKGNLLYWNKCNSDDFQFYKVVKSSQNTNPVYPGDTVITSSSNSSLTNTIDKTVAPNRTYYYRVCVVHRLAKVTCGNAAKVNY